MLISRTFAWMAVVAALVAVAAPASASPSYFDGTPYNGWEDQTGFATNDLVGYVNWIVYAPGSFPTTYSGYTPTHGEFAYVYQVFSQGTDKISTFEAEMDGDADNIGAFGAGVKPSGMPLASGDSAEWDFRTPDQGEIRRAKRARCWRFPAPIAPRTFSGGRRMAEILPKWTRCLVPDR